MKKVERMQAEMQVYFFDRNNDRKIRKMEIKMLWKGDEMA